MKPAEPDKKGQDSQYVNKKIFVGGLDPSIDNDELREFFEKIGVVKEATVLKDIKTGVSRCFGFVTFEKEEDTMKCIKENNYELKGKKIEIKKAEPKGNLLRLILISARRKSISKTANGAPFLCASGLYSYVF